MGELIVNQSNKGEAIEFLKNCKEKVWISTSHKHTVSGGIICQYLEPHVAQQYLEKWDLDDWGEVSLTTNPVLGGWLF